MNMKNVAKAIAALAGVALLMAAAPADKAMPDKAAKGQAKATEMKADAAKGDMKKMPPMTDQQKRGMYLVTIAGCNDCHTPMKMTPIGPAPDFERMLSGHPAGDPDPAGTLGPGDIALEGHDLTVFKEPFGIVYARNLTPDKTGLADWTEEQFIKTIRTGRHQGDGRALLPPMPWMMIGQMTDEDLKAVFAFLKSIKPINNAVPDPKVPPPVLEQFVKTNASIVDMMKSQKM